MFQRKSLSRSLDSSSSASHAIICDYETIVVAVLKRMFQLLSLGDRCNRRESEDMSANLPTSAVIKQCQTKTNMLMIMVMFLLMR
jgi:hypothetical protein